MLTVTYLNKANGELRTLSMDRPAESNSNELAWGPGLRVVCKLAGWNIHDVRPQVIEVLA